MKVTFLASPTLIERARRHVVLEVEDEALRSSAVHISGDNLGTFFEHENPCLAIVIGQEEEVVPGDHSRTVAPEERLNIGVLALQLSFLVSLPRL
jgi:hypothetical protein